MEENPQVIFSWRAPLRPYKKKSSTIIRFYIAVALLLSLIMYFFGDKILLIPIWALVFIFYVLTITPPPDVDNKINAFGIELAGVALRWEILSHFYFGKRFGFYTLTIVSRAPYFYHAYAVIPNEEIKKKLLSLLAQNLIYQEKPEKKFTDKAVDWLSNLVPDEEDISTKEGLRAVSERLKKASL